MMAALLTLGIGFLLPAPVIPFYIVIALMVMLHNVIVPAVIALVALICVAVGYLFIKLAC